MKPSSYSVGEISSSRTGLLSGPSDCEVKKTKKEKENNSDRAEAEATIIIKNWTPAEEASSQR